MVSRPVPAPAAIPADHATRPAVRAITPAARLAARMAYQVRGCASPDPGDAAGPAVAATGPGPMTTPQRDEQE